MKKKKKNNPFDYIKQITTKRKPKDFEYDKKICSGYLLSFFLSHSTDLLPLVQDMNRVQYYVKDKYVYDYYYDVIPQGDSWLGLIKKKVDNKEKEEIEEIKLKYQVSTREARLIRAYKERLK